MDDGGSEDDGWTIETRQVEWTFVPGEDVLEKLSKLYPFRSAYGNERADERVEGQIAQSSIRHTSPESDSISENDFTDRPSIDVSTEAIDRLKQLIVKELCSGTVSCIVMDDPDEHYCVMVQLHFKLDDIENFYKNLSDWVSLIAIGQPHAKHIHRDQWVAVEYMGTWHRAIVNTVLSHSLITVKLVDHGATVSLPLSSMRPLPDKLVAIPPKAMRCRLLGSFGQVRSGCILEAFPLPSSINNGVIQEPLPLKVLSRSYDDDETSADESGLHHTLTLDSPKSSRRPPLPQSTKQNANEPTIQRKDPVEKALRESDVVNGLKGSYPFVSNSEGESDTYETLYKPYIVNITSPLSSSESCCSSDVGSVFSETNGVVNHVQRLIGKDESNLEYRITNPARQKSEQKTSAVTTLCCRIKSSVLRRKS